MRLDFSAVLLHSDRYSMTTPYPSYPQLQGATVLVTGGAGFIGSHLCERLLREGARVVAFDNLLTGRESNVAHLRERPSFTFMHGDVNVREDLEQAFADHPFDYVFHYAAVVGVKRVHEEPLSVLRDIDGLQYIAMLSRASKVKKLVFASSSEAYGEPVRLPERESGEHNVNPRDPYGLVKLLGENLMHVYFTRYKLATCSLRFFNVYGPRQEGSAYGFVVGVFLNQVLSGEAPTIFGDGRQTRDFVYVDDNVEAALRALLHEKSNGETINVGSGGQTTILDLAERIVRLSGKDLAPVFLAERPIEIRYRAPDTTKMRALLDFSPQVGLDEGLRRTYEWYQSKPG